MPILPISRLLRNNWSHTLPGNDERQRSPMSATRGQTPTARTEAGRGWSRTREQPSLGLAGSRARKPPPRVCWRQRRELFKSHVVPFILCQHPGLSQSFSRVAHRPAGVLAVRLWGLCFHSNTGTRPRAGAEAPAGALLARGSDPAGRGVAMLLPSTLLPLTHTSQLLLRMTLTKQ